MCRLANRMAPAVVMLAALVAARPACAQAVDPLADPDATIEAYLETLGLRDLLVTQLEARMDRARSSERTAIAERLAAIYSVMLEEAGSAEERIALVARGRALLEQAPDADSAALRLSLDRASFTRAERLAERARLLLGGPEERREAEAVFSEIAIGLSRLAQSSNDRVRALERQEESMADFDPELLSEALVKARRARSMAHYLAGWAKTYLAEMSGALGPAGEALSHFGWLLNAPPNQPPTVARIPTATLEFEHVARAVVGSAVAESALGETARALALLEVVEASEHTPGVVSAELAARRMTILARGNRWAELLEYVMSRRTRSSVEGELVRLALDPGEARLLGVLSLSALERIDTTRDDPARAARDDIETLAQVCMTDLASRNEIGHMLDLTMRFGVGALGEDRFISRHVRGLRDYQTARQAHAEAGNDTRPTESSRVIDLYRRAETALRGAFGAEDAVEHPDPRATDAMLIGLCRYYASGGASGAARLRELDEATAWLVRGADGFERDTERRADAMSVAIKALDEGAELAADVEGADALAWRARRDEAAARFLEWRPDDARAGTLLIRLATSEGVDAERAVALLQRVPEGSEAHDAAERLAARRLYDLYRTARPAQRQWAAMRYADAAEPLLLHDRALVSRGDEVAVDRVIVRGRRLLDALLSVDAPDAARAQSALDLVLGVVAETGRGGDELMSELRYREAQIALASGMDSEAERVVDELRAGASEAYRDAAARLLHRRAVIEWRDAKRRSADSGTIVGWSRRVVEHGGRLLLTLQDTATAESAPETDSQTDAAAIFTLRATIAEATADLWRYADDTEARGLSIDMHTALLEIEPGNRTVLRRLAELAEDAGDDRSALDAWRRLASGLAQGSDEWFEARLRQLTLLSRVDRDRAAVAMRQHRALWPELGPAPWGERFAELERRLGLAQGSERERTEGGAT